MDALRVRLSRSMDETAARLGSLGITPWLKPQAGIFLWCRLPDGVDAADIARRCLADEIVLAPGNVFSHSQSAGNFMRFNVAQSSDARLFRSLERAIAAGLAKM
jgi:DNA-binding transcriptional MocR family regulator